MDDLHVRAAGSGQGSDQGAGGRRRPGVLRRSRTSRRSSVDTDAPRVSCTVQGEPVEIVGDFIAGCDGFHGVCRHSIPAGALTTYEHAYPFAWLGILAAVAPSTEELIYAVHERGFALHSMRSPAISRLYLQVGPAEPLDDWPDERIWAELRPGSPSTAGKVLNEGPILSRGVTAMRSFVGRTDAVWTAVPGRGRGAHRATERRQGAQPGGGGRSACWRRPSPPGTRTAAVSCWTGTPGPPRRRVAGTGVLRAHDVAAAPIPGRGRLRGQAATGPASATW